MAITAKRAERLKRENEAKMDPLCVSQVCMVIEIVSEKRQGAHGRLPVCALYEAWER